MAKPLSKSKIVAHIAEKVGTSKKPIRRSVVSFFEELFKLAVKEAKGGAGKFVIPNIGPRREGAPQGAHGPQSARRAKRSRSRPRPLFVCAQRRPSKTPYLK